MAFNRTNTLIDLWYKQGQNSNILFEDKKFYQLG